MNRLAHWMIRLYPSRWRNRYGDELDALLAQTSADARMIADLAGGGIRMQFSTWSFPKLAVVLGTAGMLLGALGSFLSAPAYISESTLQIDAATEQRLEPIVLSRQSLAQIINNPLLQLYRDEQKVEPLEEVIETMRQSIAIRPTPGSGKFTISFQYTDPERARGALDALTGEFTSLASSTPAPARSTTRGYVDVIDNASLPIWTTFPVDRVVSWLSAILVLGGVVSWRISRRKSILTWKFGLALASSFVVGLGAGQAMAYFAIHANGGAILPGARFRSTALVYLNGTPAQNQSLLRDAITPSSLASFVTTPPRNKNEWIGLPIEALNRHLTIQPAATDPHYFRVSYESRDRFEAQRTVSMVLNLLDFTASRYPAILTSAGVPATIQPALLQLPALPASPVTPNRMNAATWGGLTGLLAAALIAIFRNRWKPEPEYPINPVSE